MPSSEDTQQPQSSSIVEKVTPASSEPQMINEDEEVDNYFKASDFPQPPELQEFFKEKLAFPFNKYCLDCKKAITSHALIWYGVFVCKDCAALHRQHFGGQSQNYIKDVHKDHWDDYQLKSI